MQEHPVSAPPLARALRYFFDMTDRTHTLLPVSLIFENMLRNRKADLRDEARKGPYPVFRIRTTLSKWHCAQTESRRSGLSFKGLTIPARPSICSLPGP